MKTRITLSALVAAALALPAAAVQGTIYTAADHKSGDIKWQARSKTYYLSYKKGKTDVSAEFPLADVVRLEIAKPAGYDKAVEAVERGAGAGAIAPLQKIVAEYRMLQWDQPAGRYLALAYIDAGQAPKALAMCEEIIQQDPDAAWRGDLAAAYWKALMKLGKTEKLEKALKKAMTGGSRQAAAAAYVMRGDLIFAAAKDSHDELKRALRDGYLRTALMFGDEECARERQEAQLKAAECFEKMGQTSRAERLRSQAKAM